MRFWGTAEVVKRHKRLQVVVVETGEVLYVPPNFVMLPSREPLVALARHFTAVGHRDIDAIARFEGRYPRKAA
jgi:hypothetical protein